MDTATLVDEVDLLDLFEQIAYMASDLYYGVSDTVKQPFHFEIMPYGEIEEDYIPVIATFIMGTGTCSNINSYPYASTDQWSIIPEVGNCWLSESGNDAMDHWRCDLNANLNYRDKNTF